MCPRKKILITQQPMAAKLAVSLGSLRRGLQPSGQSVTATKLVETHLLGLVREQLSSRMIAGDKGYHYILMSWVRPSQRNSTATLEAEGTKPIKRRPKTRGSRLRQTGWSSMRTWLTLWTAKEPLTMEERLQPQRIEDREDQCQTCLLLELSRSRFDKDHQMEGLSQRHQREGTSSKCPKSRVTCTISRHKLNHI